MRNHLHSVGGFPFSFALLLVLAICLKIRSSHAQTAEAVSVPSRGSVGIGTYATVSQFKDLLVQSGEQVLLQRDLSQGIDDFDVAGGQWKVVDGALQQSSVDGKGVTALVGDAGWTDYSVSVKARKVAGDEGFLLVFRARDPANLAWLNVGGWKNTRAQFELTTKGNRTEIGDSTPFVVEDDKWYDVKVDVKGDQATGFVDGQQVAQATLVAPANNGR